MRLPLAALDVRVEKATLTDKATRNTTVEIADALLRLQQEFAGWTTDKAARKAVLAELTAARRFVKTWQAKPRSTQPPASQPGAHVLILAPRRADMLGLVGWLGLWKEDYQNLFWHAGSVTSTSLQLRDEGRFTILALEYASPRQNGDPTLGFAMNTREQTGVLQHVLQHAAESLCWDRFGEDTDVSFVLGLATDLVIDVLGQNNARSGGSGKGSSTAAKGGFIPGAPGAGGAMSTQSADSFWRQGLGKDYFVRPLRHSQKVGARAADKGAGSLRHFVLHDNDDRGSPAVTAPFIGRAASDREAVGDAFRDDYLEFHRAYRAAFVHWLRHHAAKTKTASGDKFRTLLARLAVPAPRESFEAICHDLYGVPVAAREAGTDTLEHRFLAWIARSSR